MRQLGTTVVLAVLVLLATVLPAGTAAAGPVRCADPTVPLTVEEQRLDRPEPAKILRRSGFDTYGRWFAPALCAVPDVRVAERLVARSGALLWDAAVSRAQSRRPAGDLPAIDDRPLYWARLQLTTAVRQWTPSFELSDGARTGLLGTLERASRGQDSIRYRPGSGRRILVTGFDPFQLDDDIRRSNPSGAAALALDGRVLDTPNGPARVETMIFPVLWAPFADGVVEHALLPHLPEVDLFTTVSQGRPNQFDVERYNGRWRGGFEDNNNVSDTGVIPIPDGIPTVTPAPEFVPTSLPYRRIVDADTGRFPVLDNTTVVEIPAGETEPVTRPGGPTPGSEARAGGGGDYLSNEIAYRATLLRDALGLDLPGGHLHTPVLSFAPDNETKLTDPVFERNQRDIADQVRAVLTVAAGT